VIFGTSYIVTPACHEVDAASDECDKLEMNTESEYYLLESVYDVTLYLSDVCLLCA